MNIRRWYNNRGFFVNAMALYILCAVLPMALATGYNYQQTCHLLLEQAREGMRQDAEVLGKSVDAVFDGPQTILSNLNYDKTLNTQLCVDYTNLSFTDLAYYSNTTLDSLLVQHPNTVWLHFYSNNDTLPNTNYYKPLSELDQDVIDIANDARGEIVVSGEEIRKREDEILLISRMNYFSADTVRNYEAVAVSQAQVQEQLGQVMEGRRVYLLDQRGTILASTEQSLTSTDFDRIMGGWRTMDYDTVTERKNKSGDDVICLRLDLDMGMDMVVVVDRDPLLASARQIPLRTMLIFAMISVIGLLLISLHNHWQKHRLDVILRGTEEIGRGNFASEIEEDGNDEFGQISHAINQMSRQIDALIRENYERELLLKTSEINLLQEQINPHFLYNALSAISSMAMREGGKRTVQTAGYLADFYRLSLSKGRKVIPVDEEIRILENYVRIQQMQLMDLLEVSYEVEDSARQYRSLKLILQPLVENAIHHGTVEEQPLHIRVCVGQTADRICYDVYDDGQGIEPERLAELQGNPRQSEKGFGLRNVDIRIRLHYGEAFGVSLDSVYGQGTHVHVEIPKEKN